MQRKPNENFIRAYSEEFSEKVSLDFFESKDQITGRDILTVTPSKQVNFFVLKILFKKWQSEMKQLESPFFDYHHNEVRRAMVQFMNTLSQHIVMEESDFQDLLQAAVYDTLLLCVDPSRYIKAEFSDKVIEKLGERIFKPQLKYLKIRKAEFDSLFKESEGKSVHDLVTLSESFFSEESNEQVLLEEIASISGIIPITLDEIYFEESEEVIIQPVIEEEELLEEGLEEQQELVETEREATPEVSKGDLEDMAVESVESESFQVSEPEESVSDMDEVSQATPDSEDMSDESSEVPTTLNEAFNADEVSIADHHQQKKVSSILEAISVNHRYMFTKELFDGDREQFQSAIQSIETSKSFDDAVEMIVQDFAKDRDWDMNSDEVKELLKVVFRKFR